MQLKTYTGTKIIKAAPMNAAEYHKHRGFEASTEDDPMDGYLVEYADGYISWSPKKAFEDAYIEISNVDHLQPYQQRVVAESTQLKDNIRKLAVFIASDAFDAVYAAEQDRMREQHAAMGMYHDILAERIAAFNDK